MRGDLTVWDSAFQVSYQLVDWLVRVQNNMVELLANCGKWAFANPGDR